MTRADLAVDSPNAPTAKHAAHRIATATTTVVSTRT